MRFLVERASERGNPDQPKPCERAYPMPNVPGMWAVDIRSLEDLWTFWGEVSGPGTSGLVFDVSEDGPHLIIYDGYLE